MYCMHMTYDNFRVMHRRPCQQDSNQTLWNYKKKGGTQPKVAQTIIFNTGRLGIYMESIGIQI